MKFSKRLLLGLLIIASVVCVALAACAPANKVTLTFEVNGGDPVESVELDAGQEYDMPTPERSGYEFEGWYENSDLSGNPIAAGAKVTAQESKTYYAKWTELYTVTLQLAGGSYNGSTADVTRQVKKGGSVSAAIEDIVPTLADHEFGAWFSGENELSAAQTAQGDMTLTAKYKVKYTVQRMLQKLADDSQYEQEAESFVGYEYAGAAPALAQVTPVGFEYAQNGEEVALAALTEDVAQNSFKLYFNRTSYNFTLDSNYPEGMESEVESNSYKYETEISVPSNKFTLPGYYLLGWGTDPYGAVEYEANFMESHLFGSTEEDKPVTVKVAGDTYLYAIWCQGYVDVLGGEDYLYIPDENGDTVYLERSGVFFRGEYDKDYGEFFFEKDEKTLFEGRVNDDYTFVYKSGEGYTDMTFYLLDGSYIYPGTKILLDAYNGITYTEQHAGVSVGTYSFDTATYIYTVKFTSGVLAGQTRMMMLGSVNAVNSQTGAVIPMNVFRVRNDEEIGFGAMPRFTLGQDSDGNYGIYFTTTGGLTLNGFASAILDSGTSTTVYSYSRNAETNVLTLSTSSGSTALVAKIITVGTRVGYATYNSTYDHVYTADDGATLTLDGTFNATYTTASGETVTGYYSVGTVSSFGGNIVHVYAGGKVYSFTVRTLSVQDSATGATVAQYVMTVKGPNYAEYRFYDKTSSNLTTTPLMVLNETVAGELTVYCYDPENSSLLKIARGTYTSANGVYTATISENLLGGAEFTERTDITEELTASTFDKDVKEVVFTVRTASTSIGSLGASHWKTVKKGSDPVNVGDYKEYKEQSKEENVLTLFSGYAVLKEKDGEGKEVTYQGSYTTADSIITITVAGRGTMSIELIEEGGYYIKLDTSRGTYYAMKEDGTADRNVYLVLDGKGGATYNTVTPADGEGDPTTDTKTGTYVDVEGENAIMQFTETDGSSLTFKFMRLIATSATSTTRYFTRYNDKINGDYTVESAADQAKYGKKLHLDGYSYNAVYTPAEGEDVTGRYTVSTDADGKVTVSFVNGSATTVFDLSKEGKHFTRRGSEAGDYRLVDNMSFDGYYASLDGYGNLTIYTLGEKDAHVKVEGITCTYNVFATANGGRGVTIHFEPNDKITGDMTAMFGYLTQSGTNYPALLIEDKDVEATFVNEANMAVFTLRAYGAAYRYTSAGTENGSYVLITKEVSGTGFKGVLYYVNEDGTHAGLYNYDTTTGTVTLNEYQQTGYYTSDLQTLKFSEYGFVILNGETRCYYTIDDQNRVTLYKHDINSDDANDCGFVADTTSVPALSDTINFESKDYYKNDGWQVKFEREAENNDSYKFPMAEGGETKYYSIDGLNFSPAGDKKEFTVNATLTINGQTYSGATVSREAVYGNGEDQEPTEYKMYLNAANYRFELEVTYSNTEKSFSLNSMIWQMQAVSYSYMYTYYALSQLGLGGSVKNNYGTITVTQTFAADNSAEPTEDKVHIEVLSGSGVLNSNGKLASTVAAEEEAGAAPTVGIIESTEYTHSSSGLYTVKFTDADDGKEYALYFMFTTLNGYYVSVIQAFTRVEKPTVTGAENIEITVEHVIATERYADTGVTVGSARTVIIKENGEELTPDKNYLYDGKLYFITRTTGDDGKINSSTLYRVEFIPADASATGEEDGSPDEEGTPTVQPYAPYKSATVEKKTINTYYADNGSYVDIVDDQVLLLTIATEVTGETTYHTYYIVKCEKGAGDTYTVTEVSGMSWTITVQEGKATITLVED